MVVKAGVEIGLFKKGVLVIPTSKWKQGAGVTPYNNLGLDLEL